MTKKQVSPNAETASKTLETLWSAVCKEDRLETDREIDLLINSRYVSIRFCLPTQLLGKLVDQRLDCLCLQKGTESDEASWDPRSFANKVIAPWVAENQYVLGTSADPYVSKPLRRPRLEEAPAAVKGIKEWGRLFRVLADVQERGCEEYTRRRFTQTLRSIRKALTAQTFDYPLPRRISLKQTLTLVSQFLSESSGGARGLAVAAALFNTLGQRFNIYSEIRRHAINAADRSTGAVADIECLDSEGKVVLAVEVKERNLTVSDAQGAAMKARKISLGEMLLNAPGTIPSQEKEIERRFDKAWASGTNLYRLSIEELIRVGLTLTGEAGRVEFLQNVGTQLDEYRTHPTNRQKWKELLEDL